MNDNGLARSRVYWRPIRYEMKTFQSKKRPSHYEMKTASYKRGLDNEFKELKTIALNSINTFVPI